MKRIIIIIAVAMLSISVYSAGPALLGGIKLGLGMSNIGMGLGDALNSKARFGGEFGLYFEVKTKSVFAFSLESNFAIGGASLDGGGHLAINYLYVPFIAKFYVIKPLSIDVGPYLGVNVFVSASDGHISERAPSDAYNKFRAGILFGLTYNFRKVFLFGRYSYGLTNVLRGIETAPGREGFSNNTYSLIFGAGMKF